MKLSNRDQTRDSDDGAVPRSHRERDQAHAGLHGLSGPVRGGARRHADVAKFVETSWGIDGDVFEREINDADALIGYRFPRDTSCGTRSTPEVRPGARALASTTCCRLTGCRRDSR